MLAKNKNDKNKGQVLVIVALSLVLFIGVAALAIDVAYFYHTKHQLQGAADAAALAGAAKLDGTDDSDQPDARQEAWKFACKNQAAGQSVYLVDDEADKAGCDNIPSDLNNDNADTNDIVVGNWNGTAFSSYSTPINAVKVVARREEGAGYTYTGGGVTRFFGRIFTQTQQNIREDAIAIYIPGDAAPLAANEYWYGDNPAQFKTTYPDRLYPNSYFRFRNITTIKADGSKEDGAPSTNWGTTHGYVSPPGWPDPECKSEAFALAGENANPNTGPGDKGGLAAMDYRTNSYEQQNFVDEYWCKMTGVSTCTQIPNQGAVNPSRDTDWLPYLNGYGKDLPISIPGGEQFIRDYETNTPIYPYQSGNATPTSPTPPPAPPYNSSVTEFSTVTYISGVNTGPAIGALKANAKYQPGKKIVVLVYDGEVLGSGGRKRVTHVGYGKVKIIGYANRITDATSTSSGNSVYVCAVAELETCDTTDECKQLVEKLAPGTVRLVQ